jgi:hypothetical protein
MQSNLFYAIGASELHPICLVTMASTAVGSPLKAEDHMIYFG